MNQLLEYKNKEQKDRSYNTNQVVRVMAFRTSLVPSNQEDDMGGSDSDLEKSCYGNKIKRQVSSMIQTVTYSPQDAFFNL